MCVMGVVFKLKLNDGKIELSESVRLSAGLKEGDNVVVKVDEDGMITLQKKEPWVIAEDGYTLYTDGTDNSEEMHKIESKKSNELLDNKRDDLWTDNIMTSRKELDKAI
jgi:bifunctional DNA-binding transcriptional regulator/antitoxin component of YhaV-PrlF toxin-antitoxin module